MSRRPPEAHYDDVFLSSLTANARRGFNDTDNDVSKLYIKIKTRDDSIKVTQWNRDCYRTVYIQNSDGSLFKKVDRQPIQMDEQPLFGPLDKPHEMNAVIVEHKENLYVRIPEAPHQGAPGTRQFHDDGEQRLSRRHQGQRERFRAKGKGKGVDDQDKGKGKQKGHGWTSYYAMQIDPVDEVIHMMTRETKLFYDKQIEKMEKADEVMWSYFASVDGSVSDRPDPDLQL